MNTTQRASFYIGMIAIAVVLLDALLQKLGFPSFMF
jgi:hypothetical protein